MAAEVTLDEAIKEAVIRQQGGDLVGAEMIYDELLTYLPDHIDILHLKGVLANQRRDYATSINLINKAISLIPPEYENHQAFSSFYQNLANSYALNGQLEEAENSYKKSLELDPTNIDTKFNYAILLKRFTRYKDALTLLDDVLVAVPTYIKADYEKGLIYFADGDFKTAKEHFMKKLDVDRFDLDARINIAKACLQLEEYDEALEHFEKASKLGTNLYEPYFYMGLTSEKLGSREKAIEYYQTALYINGSLDEAKMRLEALNKQ